MLAPLALHTSHIFLTLRSSRLTLGHVNSVPPVSRDQSYRCLFGPDPYVCVWICVGVYIILHLLMPKDITTRSASPNSPSPSLLDFFFFFFANAILKLQVKATILQC